MLALQYDLFEENSEISLLRKGIEFIRTSSKNVRKGLFSRYNELMKLYLKQHEEIEMLRGLILQIKKG